MKNTQPVWLKPAIEFGPLVAFFVAYKLGGIMVSTAVTMIATVLAAIVSYAMTRKIPPMLWVTLVVVTVFGGLTLYTGEGAFFYMKPTIVMSLFALTLAGGLLMGRSLLKSLMGSALELDEAGWRKLTVRFIGFFITIAILNEIIWRTQPEPLWADFKAFGILGLNVVFILLQLPLIKRHQINAPADS
jgi:intracellular septation protein